MSTSLDEIQQESFRIASAHGFWDGPEQDNIPSKLALIHSEISEALGEFREGHAPAEVYWHYKSTPDSTVGSWTRDMDGREWFRPIYRDNPTEVPSDPEKKREFMVALGYEAKPEGFGIELADAIIRICDLAERHSIDLTEMIRLKSAYNENRPHMHNRRV